MPRHVPPAERLLAPERWRTTVGLVLMITMIAFEAMAVATVLPVAADDLGGLRLYGWAFSAFLLAQLLGIVLAGESLDRRGPAGAMLAGLLIFTGGLLVAGLAPSMEVLVVGRAIQGFGAGAMAAAVYAVFALAYDDAVRPRLMAVTSTAWVVPAVIGPAVAGLVAERLDWRLAFLGIVPLAVPVLLMLAPSLAALSPMAGIAGRDATAAAAATGDRAPAAGAAGNGRAGGRHRWALTLVAGAGLLMLAGQPGAPGLRTGAAVIGVAVVVPALRGLLPPGTLGFGAGLPAAVAVRGVLTLAFFGTEAFLPLGLTDVRGLSASGAGLALTAGALGWTAGAWAQERADGTVSRAALVRAGLLVIAVGVAGVAAGLHPALPTWAAVVAWGVAGVGMGIAYASVGLLVIAGAPPEEQGRTMAGLQIADVIGGLLGTGVGGAIVAAADAPAVSAGRIATIDVLLVVVALAGALAAGRLRGQRPGTRSDVAVLPSTVAA